MRLERNHYRKGFLLLLGILLFTAGLSCCVGRYPLTLRDLWQICTGGMEDGIKSNVFLRIRLPRTVFAGLTGAALS
ncbi:MAG: iron ABC transporter permease, partial [Ruminococcaceae bacterium]|nr:iron ABC transporter permease [Oscillospiraceae bacterium]